MRLRSLDALRGLAVVALVLATRGPQELAHALPLLLFGVGAELAYALARFAGTDPVLRRPRLPWARVAARAAALLALAVASRALERGALGDAAPSVVLLRVAVCYAGAAAVVVQLGPLVQWGILVALLALARVLRAFDAVPDEALSTLAGVALTILGGRAGATLWGAVASREHAVRMAVHAPLWIALALGLSPWLPVDARPWSATYVALATGGSLALFAALYALVELRNVSLRPLEVVGRHALVVYAGAALCAHFVDSLAFAAAMLALWYGVAELCERRALRFAV